MNEEEKNYVIPQNVILNVSEFFRVIPCSLWSRRDYSRYITSKSPSTKYNAISTAFDSDLEKIKKNPNMPPNVRSLAGIIKAPRQDKKKVY